MVSVNKKSVVTGVVAAFFGCGGVIADVTFTIDPTQTGLPQGAKGYQYCVYSQGVGLSTGTGNNYTATTASNSGSCLAINASEPLSTITADIGSIPGGTRLYIVAVDGNHTLADVTNPSSAPFGVPIQGYGGTYNPPYTALEMTGGTTLDLDISSIDWLGMPATLTLAGNPYCTTANGTGSGSIFYTSGLCNSVGVSTSIAMSDMVSQALANSELKALVFNLDAAISGSGGPYYQSVMGIQDYLAQPTSDGLNYLNNGSDLQGYMDTVVAGLFSSSNTNTYYLQGAASAQIHSPSVPADVYQCQYSITPIDLYGNNSGFATSKAQISSYIQCAPQIHTSNPSYQIYDPRQVAFLRVNSNPIQGNWSATDPCGGGGCSTSNTITWVFTPTTTVPAAVPNGWTLTQGNWISGLQGTYVIAGVNTSAGNVISVSIAPQSCTLGAGGKYFCPNPNTKLQSVGFFQANPLALAFGPSITHSVLAGTGASIDSVYQYPNQLGYSDVLGSLEDQFNEAINRGMFDNVGNIPAGCQPSYESAKPQAVTTACFDNNDYWYPDQTVRASNPWAQLIHKGANTAQTPFFIQQTLYNGNQQSPDTGNVGLTQLGMAYAFQMDENPIAATLNFSPIYQPYQVPAEWSALADGTAITVTLNPWVSSAPTLYTVSGSIAGLKGSADVTLSLQEGTAAPTTLTGTSQYTFSSLSRGAYTLKLSGMPNGVSCTFTNGLSLISLNLGPSTQADVTCRKTGANYRVGGVVTGLDPNKRLSILNNGTDALSIVNPAATNPNFEFTQSVASGSGYAVSISSNPPGQTCSVTQNGSGTAASHKNSMQVAITCLDNPSAFSVGGTVQGLALNESLGLTLNGQNQANAIMGSGTGATPIPFTLLPELANNSPYKVSVATGGNPPGKRCMISGGSGTIQSQDVTSVSVACSDDPATFKVWGKVSGLSQGDQVVVWNDGNQDTVTWPNSRYSFEGLANGSSYSLHITSSTQTCTFSGGTSGTISGANVEVDLTCVPSAGLPLSVQNQGPSSAFKLGKTQAAVVELNGGLNTAVVWGGSTTPTQIGSFASGFAYNVQIIGQSISQACADSYMTPGRLGRATTVPFTCGNSPGNITPGVCNGTYNNNTPPIPPVDVASLCDQGYSSGATQLNDGRYRWHCSGLGNPQVNPPGGTQTCYSLSNTQASKVNQPPLVVQANHWTITSGGRRSFTVAGGAGQGAVSISQVQGVGHANCTVSTQQNGSWSISATANPGTKGSGACVVWVSKAASGNYFSVDSSPAVFNVNPQSTQ